MPEQDLTTIYTVSNAVEAEIIKNALAAEGIPCMIEGENQAAEAGLIGIAIRLQVPTIEAERARKFVLQHEKHK